MEAGSLHNGDHKTCEEKPSNAELAGALAMLGLEHAHVIHEADPDIKVASLLWPGTLCTFCLKRCLSGGCLVVTCACLGR